MSTILETPKGIIKVDCPDHPFTFNGPDILLSNKKGLLAIFKIRENEQKNSNKLFVRLINSMIVYPPWTKMLFLIDRESNISNKTIQVGQFYFNMLIETNDIKKANHILRDKKSDNDIKAIMQIQKHLFRIQSQIQIDNVEYFKKTPSKTVSAFRHTILPEKRVKFYDQISQKEVTAKANIL